MKQQDEKLLKDILDNQGDYPKCLEIIKDYRYAITGTGETAKGDNRQNDETTIEGFDDHFLERETGNIEGDNE